MTDEQEPGPDVTAHSPVAWFYRQQSKGIGHKTAANLRWTSFSEFDKATEGYRVVEHYALYPPALLQALQAAKAEIERLNALLDKGRVAVDTMVDEFQMDGEAIARLTAERDASEAARSAAEAALIYGLGWAMNHIRGITAEALRAKGATNNE